MEDLLSEPHPGLEQVELEEAELMLTSTGEPCSFAEAEREEAWRAAMRDEINSVQHNKTWELVKLLAGHQAIGLKWVFKLKRDEAMISWTNKDEFEPTSGPSVSNMACVRSYPTLLVEGEPHQFINPSAKCISTPGLTLLCEARTKV
jgi:hypothetical protein